MIPFCSRILCRSHDFPLSDKSSFYIHRGLWVHQTQRQQIYVTWQEEQSHVDPHLKGIHSAKIFA